MSDVLEMPELCRCFNCGTVSEESDLGPIQDLTVRLISIATNSPAGQCPKCGCLAYAITGE